MIQQLKVKNNTIFIRNLSVIARLFHDVIKKIILLMHFSVSLYRYL